jgi:hypothetical protein
MMPRMLVVVLIALTAMTGVPPAAARECKPLYTAQGPLTQPSQGDAERMAKQAWKTQVARKYGSDYADWDKASSHNMECEESAEYFRCWAEAEPCR